MIDTFSRTLDIPLEDSVIYLGSEITEEVASNFITILEAVTKAKLESLEESLDEESVLVDRLESTRTRWEKIKDLYEKVKCKILDEPTLDEKVEARLNEIQLTMQPPEILIVINSAGGDAYAALAIIDAIERAVAKGVHIHTHVAGFAASAAAAIAISGTFRTISDRSMMMVHDVSTSFIGNYGELKKKVENTKLISSILTRHVQKYGKIPPDKLVEWMDKDTYIDAVQALAYGLVDEIGFRETNAEDPLERIYNEPTEPSSIRRTLRKIKG